MSLGYSIAATLKTPFLRDTIKTILQRGADLGFIYREYILGDLNCDSDPLSVDDALAMIYKTHQEVEMYCITIECEATYFNLNFLVDGENLAVMFPSLNSLWSRKYEAGEYDIDIQRYAEVFLSLIHDYQIANLQIQLD